MSIATVESARIVADRIPVRTRRVTSAKTISNLVLLGFGVLFAAPLLWLVFASVDSQASSSVQWPHLTMSNFSAATSGSDLHALINSVYISTIATIVSTVPATLAAYAFSRHHIPWKGPLLLFILMLAGVPVTILIVPVYQEAAQLGYLSLIPAAIFVGVTSLPFEIWIIKNFIDAVPEELEEAARLERAKTRHILLRVVMPVALPGIAAAAIFGFINAWGNFLVPLVLIPDPSQQPSPVALFGFFGSTTIHYGEVAAYSIIYSVPVVLLYVAMSRLFRGGYTLGGAIRG
jgi:multiple sugar transport system permease protein